MDPTFASISLFQHRRLESALANLKMCTDEEVRSILIAEGLSEAQATQAVRYRPLYASFIFFEGHTPVLKGYQALTLWQGKMTTLLDILKQLTHQELQALRDDFAVLNEHRDVGESNPPTS